MSFHLPNFLRFRARAPKKGPPPKNFVDAFYDPDQGKIIAINDQNEEVEFKGAGEAGAHTHVSADITDRTNDGVTNPGKILRSSTGLLDGPLTLPEVMVSGFGYTMLLGPVSNTLTNSGNTYIQTHPFASGVYGVLRNYADSTAANAAVSVGDVWWDTTLNKARVRLV
jgi:hypothetical protein